MQATFLILATFGNVFQVCKPFELDLSAYLATEDPEARLSAITLIIRTCGAFGASISSPLSAVKVFGSASGVEILSLDGEDLARELARLEEEAAFDDTLDAAVRAILPEVADAIDLREAEAFNDRREIEHEQQLQADAKSIGEGAMPAYGMLRDDLSGRPIFIV
jgi:hypothetical protein